MSITSEEALAAVREDIQRAKFLIGTSMDAMRLRLEDSPSSDMVLIATLARFIYENIEPDFVPIAFATAILQMVRAEESS